MKPTLFILAAGMGSRYGGLKQLDGLGPSGETIMDYSVYDAIRAGFGKIVFVIRHSFEQEFREKVISKYKVETELVFQELDYLPEGFTLNPEREKPWGTCHAVLMGRDVIKEPFAVLNADDFYGRESFELLAGFLKTIAGKQGSYCMIGYRLGYTLSDSGSVARGICELDENNYLTQVTEITNIESVNGIPSYENADGKKINLPSITPVSMNMWGFTPDYFDLVEESFIEFLEKHQHELKSECLIPNQMNEIVKEGKVKVKLIPTPSTWFGVTYSSDRPDVVNRISELVDKGIYPSKLF